MYIHTDGAWERPPGRAAFHAHAGWSGQLMGNLSAVRKQWECCWRAPANVESCYKYDWLLHASSPRRRAGGWLGVLADSDVLFQCSAEELRVRSSGWARVLTLALGLTEALTLALALPPALILILAMILIRRASSGWAHLLS